MAPISTARILKPVSTGVENGGGSCGSITHIHACACAGTMVICYQLLSSPTDFEITLFSFPYMILKFIPDSVKIQDTE